MAAGFSLKDQLFNAETVGHLGGLFQDAGVFKSAPFVDQVMAGMLPLELKARINFIADVLSDHLPDDFPTAAQAITKALPQPLDPTKTDDDFGHFIYAPLGVYVENHGLADHFDVSLDTLEALTQRFSMEFSIRAFLNHDQDTVLTRMQHWLTHKNYHVRRLVSEGTRPRLPWGQNVGLTEAETLPLLDKLHTDPTRFVTRSVANHLNEITKKQPDIVLDRLAKWQKAGKQDAKELDWMTRHALRGLIKQGHAGAMRHLGMNPDEPVTVTQFGLSDTQPKRGDIVTLDATLTTENPATLIVDYVVNYVKANGTTKPKVFKVKTLTTKANTPASLSKKHHFKDNATTFKLYPGAHRVALQVNGRIVAAQEFTLH